MAFSCSNRDSSGVVFVGGVGMPSCLGQRPYSTSNGDLLELNEMSYCTIAQLAVAILTIVVVWHVPCTVGMFPNIY